MLRLKHNPALGLAYNANHGDRQVLKALIMNDSSLSDVLFIFTYPTTFAPHSPCNVFFVKHKEDLKLVASNQANNSQKQNGDIRNEN